MRVSFASLTLCLLHSLSVSRGFSLLHPYRNLKSHPGLPGLSVQSRIFSNSPLRDLDPALATPEELTKALRADLEIEAGGTDVEEGITALQGGLRNAFKTRAVPDWVPTPRKILRRVARKIPRKDSRDLPEESEKELRRKKKESEKELQQARARSAKIIRDWKERRKTAEKATVPVPPTQPPMHSSTSTKISKSSESDVSSKSSTVAGWLGNWSSELGNRVSSWFRTDNPKEKGVK